MLLVVLLLLIDLKLVDLQRSRTTPIEISRNLVLDEVVDMFAVVDRNKRIVLL